MTRAQSVHRGNLWIPMGTQERFYSGKTRQLHATHLTKGDRSWFLRNGWRDAGLCDAGFAINGKIY